MIIHLSVIPSEQRESRNLRTKDPSIRFDIAKLTRDDIKGV